jgi:hypothetical protein
MFAQLALHLKADASVEERRAGEQTSKSKPISSSSRPLDTARTFLPNKCLSMSGSSGHWDTVHLLPSTSLLNEADHFQMRCMLRIHFKICKYEDGFKNKKKYVGEIYRSYNLSNIPILWDCAFNIILANIFNMLLSALNYLATIKPENTLSQKRWMKSLLIMKRKIIHPMEWKVSFYRMNAFSISLLTMKSSIAFGTVYSVKHCIFATVISSHSVKNLFWKEWGFFSTYYTYITVFIRNAANLTLLLLKGSKLRKGNKN